MVTGIAGMFDKRPIRNKKPHHAYSYESVTFRNKKQQLGKKYCKLIPDVVLLSCVKLVISKISI